MAQALIYLSWLQFVTQHVVNDKQHVFINVDETSVSAVKSTGKGMVATGKIKQESRWRPVSYTHLTLPTNREV